MTKALREIVEHRAFNSISSAILICAYAYFLYNHILGIQSGTISSIAYIFVAMESTVLILVLLRNNPKIRSDKMLAWISAFMGTTLPLFLQPTDTSLNVMSGSILMVLGGSLAILAYLSLNKSFGVSPALRSVKTNGLYTFIRHPMYASYIVMYLGYLQLAFSWLNVAILLSTLLFILARIYFEEQLLSIDSGYLAYKKKVPYRLLPFVF